MKCGGTGSKTPKGGGTWLFVFRSWLSCLTAFWEVTKIEEGREETIVLWDVRMWHDGIAVSSASQVLTSAHAVDAAMSSRGQSNACAEFVAAALGAFCRRRCRC